METKDLWSFGYICIILMSLFIALDTQLWSCQIDLMSVEKIGEPLGIYDLWCIINAEIYEPFIYLFAALWIIFWGWATIRWIVQKLDFNLKKHSVTKAMREIFTEEEIKKANLKGNLTKKQLAKLEKYLVNKK